MPTSEAHFTPPITEKGRAMPPFLSPSEQMRSDTYHETWNELQVRGWKKASVIRLLPWTLTLDGVCHQQRQIPGVPQDEQAWKNFIPRVTLKGGISIPYIHHIVADPYITVGSYMRGVSAQDSYASIKGFVDMPIALAQDMVQQNARFESQGGMIAYEGVHSPGENESTELEIAFSTMTQHLDAKLRQAEEAYVSQNKHQLREVTRRNRWAVQYLLNAGLIAQPPHWFTERMEGSKEQSTKCPNCQTRVNSAALSCTCGFILQPHKAYGVTFSEETPGGVIALRRLTKEQLEGLGLYPRIKPMAEWIADQNTATEAAKKTAKPKKED